MVQPADLDKWAKDQGFPQLADVAAKQTSPFDRFYNCIAHAFEDDQDWWWPTGQNVGGHDAAGTYWPIPSDQRSALQAFLDWFSYDGWQQTQSDAFNPTMKRIALYTRANAPTHAARQIGPDLWTSKLGRGLDLSHTLAELDGPNYGSVYAIFEKPI